jgi:ABC-type transporter Mla MlaB component
MSAEPAKSVAFAISGRITREGLPALFDRACRLVQEGGVETVHCDVHDAECDAVTVDALARLQLATRRNGCRMELRGACPDLLALLEFMGLGAVLTAQPMSSVDETGRIHDPTTKEEQWPASSE